MGRILLGRAGCGIVWLAVTAWGCSHGGSSCAEMDGGWDMPCLTANEGCEARGTCPGPRDAGTVHTQTPCEQEDALFRALFLDPEAGYGLPVEMQVYRAEYGLLELVEGEVTHRIALPGVDFGDWFSRRETVSLEYDVDAPYRGLEVTGAASTLLQLAQSSAPLPNGFRLLRDETGCAFERRLPGPGPYTRTVGGLRVVDPSEAEQLTEPGQIVELDGWLVAGVSETWAASSDGTRAQQDLWAAIALATRPDEE